MDQPQQPRSPIRPRARFGTPSAPATLGIRPSSVVGSAPFAAAVQSQPCRARRDAPYLRPSVRASSAVAVRAL
eukprot:6485884-Amphidinium_carterae.1